MKMATSFLTSLTNFYKQLVGPKELHLESKSSPDESFSESLSKIAKFNAEVLLRLCELEVEVSLRDASRNRCDDL